MQALFARAAKQVIVDLELIAKKKTSWKVGEEEDDEAQGGAKKEGVKRAIEEATKGDDKSSSSFVFNNVFDMNYSLPSWRSQRL